MRVLDIAEQSGGNGVERGVAGANAALPKVWDLRLKRREGEVDLLLRRAEALPKQDRLLLETMLREGKTAVVVAGLMQTNARALRRRTKRLARRLTSPEFLFVIREIGNWPPTRRRVAEACVIEGKSARQAAADLRITFHTVRRHIEAMAHAFEAANPGQPWNAPPGFFRAPRPTTPAASVATGGAA